MWIFGFSETCNLLKSTFINKVVNPNLIFIIFLLIFNIFLFIFVIEFFNKAFIWIWRILIFIFYHLMFSLISWLSLNLWFFTCLFIIQLLKLHIERFLNHVFIITFFKYFSWNFIISLFEFALLVNLKFFLDLIS